MTGPMSFLSGKEQRKIIEETRKAVRDAVPGAARFLASDFVEDGTGDFVIAGKHGELAISNVAIRLSPLQQMALMGQITQGMTFMMMAQAQEMQKLEGKQKES